MVRYFFVFWIYLFCSGAVLAAPSIDPMKCIEQTDRYFPYSVVAQALSIQRIYQSSYDPIVRELKEESKNVPALIRKRAVQVIPNPLQYPYNYAWIKEVWINSLEEMFARIMTTYYQATNPVNRSQMQEMFNYIYRNHLEPTFGHCFPIPPLEMTSPAEEPE